MRRRPRHPRPLRLIRGSGVAVDGEEAFERLAGVVVQPVPRLKVAVERAR